MKAHYTDCVIVTGGITMTIHIDDVPKFILKHCYGDREEVKRTLNFAFTSFENLVLQELSVSEIGRKNIEMKPKSKSS